MKFLNCCRWILILAAFVTGMNQHLNAQCRVSANGIYYYCDPGYSTDSFYVGFCTKGNRDTFEIIDLVSGRKNRGFKSPNNGANSSVLNAPLIFTVTDTSFYVQFGPFKNNDSFNIRIRNTGDPNCFTEILKGRYTCRGKRAPGGCDTTDVPFYDIDFTGQSLPSLVIL
ncbi:MAG TPA: hypothetical protein VFX48_09625, partial [Saprospiraceae bacterium]|nr:hypothetical protein [Saprospiraceae bacterium]